MEKEVTTEASDETKNTDTQQATAVTEQSAETQKTEHMIPKTRLDEEIGKRKKLEAQIEKAQKEREAAEKKALEEKGEFKALYEKEKAAREALANDNLLLTKRDAVLAKLSNPDLKCNSELVMQLINFDTLEQETDTGTITGIDEEIKRLQGKYPSIFTEDKLPGSDNTATGQTGGGKIDLVELARKDPKAYAAYMKEKGIRVQ